MAEEEKKETNSAEESHAAANSTNFEQFKVKGDELLVTVRKIINEGNARRIIIRDKDNKTIAEFPLTVGVVGAVFVPVLAAVGAIAALVTNCTILVERR